MVHHKTRKGNSRGSKGASSNSNTKRQLNHFLHLLRRLAHSDKERDEKIHLQFYDAKHDTRDHIIGILNDRYGNIEGVVLVIPVEHGEILENGHGSGTLQIGFYKTE